MDLSDRNLPNKTNLKFDQDFKACWSFFFEIKVLNEFNALGAFCPWQCLDILYISCQVMVREQTLKLKNMWYKSFSYFYDLDVLISLKKNVQKLRSFNQPFWFCLAYLTIFPSKSTKVSFCHWPLLHWWISPWAESIRPHSR